MNHAIPTVPLVNNPKRNEFYIGERNNQFVVRPDTSNLTIQKSLLFLHNIHTQNKKILFVTTRPRFAPIVKQVARTLNQEFAIGKWIGGKLTNQWNRPDCVVLLDPTNDILNEAFKINVPIISFFQSNTNDLFQACQSGSMESCINYPIPGPNNSFDFVHSYFSKVLKALSIRP